jgi:hypothetical protein
MKSAIKMMMGIGTPNNKSKIERMMILRVFPSHQRSGRPKNPLKPLPDRAAGRRSSQHNSRKMRLSGARGMSTMTNALRLCAPHPQPA